MISICVNGKFLAADEPALLASNRGFRYGDGVFETMKMVNGRIILEDLHFQRLFQSLQLLKFQPSPLFTTEILRKHIFDLCKENKCSQLARVRLTVFRGNGGIYEINDEPHYVIESWSAEPAMNTLNEKGLTIDIFPGMQKNGDVFANLKSANHLIYVMAAKYVREQGLDDCLVTNVKGYVADATIANVFLIKNKLIITPALSEGCIKGVMRSYLIDKLKKSGFEIREGVVTKNDIESFDEIFLTNAMFGLRWVAKFRDRTYTNTKSRKIFDDFIAPLYK
jgi:branched-chain amino acid aminotransferase